MRDDMPEIGDERDIPMVLGLIAIAWNSCELAMRHALLAIVTRGAPRNGRLADVLISELGTLGLEQALYCYADEFAPEQADLAEALRHGVKVAERLKAYRNFYIHGIRGITHYGLDLGAALNNPDTPWTDLRVEGPFANIYLKSAKGKAKFHYTFIGKDKLVWLNHQLADLDAYLRDLNVSLRHFLRGKNYRKTAPLPARPPLPDVLTKPGLHHRELRLPPQLARRARKARTPKSV